MRAVLLGPHGVPTEDIEHRFAVAQEPATSDEPDVARGRRGRVQARYLGPDVRY